MSTPLFSTMHSPVGAWASFVFGAVGRGACVRQNGSPEQSNVDFLVGVHRGGVTTVFPFMEEPEALAGWRVLEASEVTRTLTPCVDEFSAAAVGMTLRVLTPHTALPNPKRSGNLQYATAPGVVLEVVIDNSGHDSPATAFVGLNDKSGTFLRPADWSSKALCGVGKRGEWLLAATMVKEEVFTVQSSRFAEHVATSEGAGIDGGSAVGGVVIRVPAGATKTVHLVMAFFDGGVSGSATQGIPGRYLYTAYFPRVEAVANFLLINAQKIRESCVNLDKRLAASCEDADKLAAFSQAVRGYEGRTQLTDSEGVPYFTVLDEAGRRNALDAAVEQLPWELFRNPWVVRNIVDLYTGSYSYRDQLKGEGEGVDAGLMFTRDCGLGSCYSPSGTSASENSDGHQAFMSTESLLNGVYLLTSYALVADDTPWAKTRLPFARDLLLSMEQRDDAEPEKRTGILKRESAKAISGEVTAYAGCGAAMERVPGNLVLAVKTFCATLMLTTYFQGNNDLHSADYSYAFAQKTAAALVAAFDESTGVLRANLVHDSLNVGKILAALEPLAVPTYLGLMSTLSEYFPELYVVLKRHAEGCLKAGCVDAATGGLRLVSGCTKSMSGKVVSVLYVLERLFGVNVQQDYPGMWRQVMQCADDPGTLAVALFLKEPVVSE